MDRSWVDKFEVTEEHIKLLQNMFVGWQDDEFGAPEIDPKRPYGNSSVLEDIHEILTGETIGSVDSTRDELTDEENERYTELHQETGKALQILLRCGTLTPGHYISEKYTRKWQLDK